MSNTNSLESSAASQPLQGNGNEGGRSLVKLIKTPIAFVHEHLFSISVIAILLFGWSRRDDNYLTAETGAVLRPCRLWQGLHHAAHQSATETTHHRKVCPQCRRPSGHADCDQLTPYSVERHLI